MIIDNKHGGDNMFTFDIRLFNVLINIFDNLSNWFFNHLDVTGVFTIFLVFLTTLTAYTGLKTFKESISPQIDFSLEESKMASKNGGITAKLFLHMINRGKTPAYNLTIESLQKVSEYEQENFANDNGQKPLMNICFNNPLKINYFPSGAERWYYSLDAEKIFNDEKENFPSYEFLISWEFKGLLMTEKRKQTILISYEDFYNSVIVYEHDPLTDRLKHTNNILEKINSNLEKSELIKIKEELQKENRITRLIKAYKQKHFNKKK